MTTLSLTDAVNATVIDAALTNNNNSALKTVINGGLDNTNIASGAAIVYSKLSLALGVVNADVSASAAIALTKLAATGSLLATDIELGGATVIGAINLVAATTAAGGISFGADTPATNLYRSAVSTLKTDADLNVSGKVLLRAIDGAAFIGGVTAATAKYLLGANGFEGPMFIKAGAPIDSDFDITAVSGLFALDTTNSRFYCRVGTVWKSVALA